VLLGGFPLSDNAVNQAVASRAQLFLGVTISSLQSARLNFAPMKKSVTLAVGSVIVLAFIYFALFGVRTTRPESLRRQIAQNVRVGCSPDEVIRYLDSQHLKRSSLFRLDRLETLHGTYGDAPVILARKQHTFRAWWGFESIRLIFVFDERNQLLRFDLRPEYTAL
jgi:hypothetical protein